LNNFDNAAANGDITRDGLENFREHMLRAGEIKKLEVSGLRPDRTPVMVGGFAIMSAAFSELGIRRMSQAMGALRQGVLYDLLGRFHKQDMREVTVKQFMQRYRVDASQAGRVEALALFLAKQLLATNLDETGEMLQILSWTARLHEVGISVAHSGYQKHSAYILGNADMPGFSRMEQQRMSMLARGHRGSFSKAHEFVVEPHDVPLLLALRFATLFYRSRSDIPLPNIGIRFNGSEIELAIDGEWLERNPLTQTALSAEMEQWTILGFDLGIGDSSQAIQRARQREA
jgi:exopolyphosphatase/guanosine-5'-triphosphate,3'-diphosphate pyrophosphatase